MQRAASGGTSRVAPGVLVVVAAAVGFGSAFHHAAAAVAATVTIGSPDVDSAQLDINCQGHGACIETYAQLSQPTAGVLLTAPAEGVITAWRVHGDTGGDGSLALRVLRRDPDGVRFTPVATSPAVTAASGDGNPFHAVSIPVETGDYIGLDLVKLASPDPGARVSVFATQPAGASVGQWENGFPDGATAAPTMFPARLMLGAEESLRPAVSGVSPASGSTAGGEAVTISGSDLDGATGVSFGGTPAASFTASASQITAMAPARAPGTIDVRVTGPGGVSPVTAVDAFSYVGSSGGGSPGVGVGLVAIGRETFSPRAFAAAPSGPSALAAGRRYGTKVTYTLSEPAGVRFRVVQPRAGRKARGGRCVKPTKTTRRARKCTRSVLLRGSFTRAGSAGANRFRFTGRLAQRKLQPGKYRLVATPSAGGKAGRPASSAFRIIQ